jgi:hypothetical protein
MTQVVVFLLTIAAGLAAVEVPAAAQRGRAGVTPTQDVAQLQLSRAQAEVVAAKLYRALLDRAGTASELSQATVALQRGGLVAQVNSITAGAEFRRGQARQSAAEMLEQVYEGMLERAPDSSGAAGFMPLLEQRRYSDVVLQIAQSDEFRTRFLSAATPTPEVRPTRLASALDCQARALGAARREASGLVFWSFDRMPEANGNAVYGPAVDRFDNDRQLNYRCDGSDVTYVYADRGRAVGADRRLEFPSGAVRACLASARDNDGRAVTFDAAGLTATDTRTEYVIGLAANTQTRFVCEMEGTRVIRTTRQ